MAELNFLTISQKALSKSITSASSTFKLNNIKSWKTNALGQKVDLVAGDFGTRAFGAFRNDTGTVLEIFEFDPATIAATDITIVKRGLDFNGDLTTETTSYKLDWPAGTVVHLGTDVPQLFQYLKEYVDIALIAGTIPASTTAGGIVIEASLAEIQAGTATKVGTNGTFKLFAPLDKLLTWINSFTASETAFGFVEEATDAQVTAGTAIGETGKKLFVTPAKLKTNIDVTVRKFGGTGADDALAITSGATNIDLAGAQVVIKNYTSISITGTGSLTFTNPHANGTTIILKSQGDVTLTSSTAPMIVASGLGGIYGAGVSGTNSSGNAGTAGYGGIISAGGGGPHVDPSTAGYGGLLAIRTTLSGALNKTVLLTPGGGGGSGGGSSTGTSGNGGRGGGALLIECNGTLNFTTASGISVNGTDAAAGTGVGSKTPSGGGGGGVAIILYNVAGTITGTITSAGGAGNNTGNTGGSAGSGASGVSSGTAGAANAQGPSGADGTSYVGLNTEFA